MEALQNLKGAPVVLLTGAGGFVGRHTARRFAEEGWHVLALVHRQRPEALMGLVAEGRASLLAADLEEPEALEARVQAWLAGAGRPLGAVVHVAAHASDVGPRRLFRRLNLEATQAVARLALALDAPRFVFVSTTDVYGLRDFHGEDEDALPLHNNTGNLYPEYKIQAERWLWAELPPERLAIVRPAAVFGADDPTLLPRVLAFLRQSPWIVHFGPWRGRNRWPMAQVENVALALFLAATSPRTAGKAVNVLDPERTSVDEFYALIAERVLGRTGLGRLYLPGFVGLGFAGLVTGLSRLLGRLHPLGDPSLYAARTVMAELDFSCERLLALCEAEGRRLKTRAEGLAELRPSPAGAPRGGQGTPPGR